MFTYRNAFHGTEVRSRLSDEELQLLNERIYYGKASEAEKAYRRRMRKTLCGSEGCVCGDEFGRR